MTVSVRSVGDFGGFKPLKLDEKLVESRRRTHRATATEKPEQNVRLSQTQRIKHFEEETFES